MNEINPNALRQWMDFYRQNIAPPQRGNTPGVWSPNTDSGVDASNWALNMLQQQNGPQAQQAPNFFANVPSSTQPPMAPQDGYNRLAMLMGRRN